MSNYLFSSGNLLWKKVSDTEKWPKSSNRSSLNSLKAFIHALGSIRVGGRLRNADLSFDQQHPTVLLRKCDITTLIVQDLHLQCYHANFSLLLLLVRRRWWIIGGVNKLVKSVVRQCVFCSRLGSQGCHQIMTDLPTAWVQVSRPFTPGVDYAGPLSIKCTNHRTTKFNKAYLAFFICFATKAVHIEVVGALTTEAFLSTFDRFISRRGVPFVMYSDNATNFVGFANIIAPSKLVDFTTKRKFSWKFIPARSPHVGGLWEVAIKTGKRILLKAIGQQILTLEQLNTITTKVEAILNLRPLCKNVSAEMGYLTPAHFLVGCALGDTPAIEKFSVPLSQRYRNMQQILQTSVLLAIMEKGLPSTTPITHKVAKGLA